MVPSVTCRSMPSSTTWSPKDLRSPLAAIAGVVTVLLSSARDLGGHGCDEGAQPRFQPGFTPLSGYFPPLPLSDSW